MAAIPSYTTADVLPPNELGEIDSPFGKLPEEVLFRILWLLAPQERVGEVCRRWARVSSDNSIWKERFTRAFGIEPEIKPESWKTHFIATCLEKGFLLRLVKKIPDVERKRITQWDHRPKCPYFLSRGSEVLVRGCVAGSDLARGFIYDLDRPSGREKINVFPMPSSPIRLSNGFILFTDSEQKLVIWDPRTSSETPDQRSLPLCVRATRNILELSEGKILLLERQLMILDLSKPEGEELECTDIFRPKPIPSCTLRLFDGRAVLVYPSYLEVWNPRDSKEVANAKSKVRKERQLKIPNEILSFSIPLRDGRVVTCSHLEGKSKIRLWTLRADGRGQLEKQIPTDHSKIQTAVEIENRKLITLGVKRESCFFEITNLDNPVGKESECALSFAPHSYDPTIANLGDGRIALGSSGKISIFSIGNNCIEREIPISGHGSIPPIKLIALSHGRLAAITTEGLYVWQVPPPMEPKRKSADGAAGAPD